jgi:hypothetical protein
MPHQKLLAAILRDVICDEWLNSNKGTKTLTGFFATFRLVGAFLPQQGIEQRPGVRRQQCLDRAGQAAVMLIDSCQDERGQGKIPGDFNFLSDQHVDGAGENQLRFQVRLDQARDFRAEHRPAVRLEGAKAVKVQDRRLMPRHGWRCVLIQKTRGTASEDKTAQVWNAATGTVIAEPMRHDGWIYSAQFSADGHRVVTASRDKTARVWDAATGKALGEPMRHDGWVNSAQFSADGQRVVTASWDKTAQVWDMPTISNQDTPSDVLLLADLAEAACGSVLQNYGQAEILRVFPADQVRAAREKIAPKFERQSSGLTPVERLLKWSVGDPRRRTISPFSKLTVPEWIEHRIAEGTLDNLRTALQVDPANARLAAHFGSRLASYALERGTDPNQARRARAEAD